MAIAQGAGGGGGSDLLANILASSKNKTSSKKSFEKTLDEYKAWYKGNSSAPAGAPKESSYFLRKGSSGSSTTTAPAQTYNSYLPIAPGQVNRPRGSGLSTAVSQSTPIQRSGSASTQSSWRDNSKSTKRSSGGGGNSDARETYSDYNLPNAQVTPRQPWEGQETWDTKRGSFTNKNDYKEIWKPKQQTPIEWAEQKIWEAKREAMGKAHLYAVPPSQSLPPVAIPRASDFSIYRIPTGQTTAAPMTDTIAPAPLPASRSGDPRASVYSQTPSPMVYNSVYLPIAPMNPMQFGMPEDFMQARFRRWR